MLSAMLEQFVYLLNSINIPGQIIQTRRKGLQKPFLKPVVFEQGH